MVTDSDKGGYVGYVVLIHETLHEGMQSFPTTLYMGVEVEVYQTMPNSRHRQSLWKKVEKVG